MAQIDLQNYVPCKFCTKIIASEEGSPTISGGLYAPMVGDYFLLIIDKLHAIRIGHKRDGDKAIVRHLSYFEGLYVYRLKTLEELRGQKEKSKNVPHRVNKDLVLSALLRHRGTNRAHKESTSENNK